MSCSESLKGMYFDVVVDALEFGSSASMYICVCGAFVLMSLTRAA